MRLIVCTLALMLSACAKPSATDAVATASCAEYPSAYTVQYPDGQLLKSTISFCGGYYLVQAIDRTESFTTQRPQANRYSMGGLTLRDFNSP